MNIFFLDLNQRKCAKWHVDKHVVKMILESTQLLWSVFYHDSPYIIKDEEKIFFPDFIPENIKIYKLTHKNHPMALWTRKNQRLL